MNRPEPIPEGSLLLHLGPQKTGSTAIQMAMHEKRAELAANGVLYPGTTLRSREAGWAAMGVAAAVGRPAPQIAWWQRLVEEIDSTNCPRICVSNEDFARADEAAIQRILTDLRADRTHLVFVARRLDKLLPSHWQEMVKARLTASYPDFLEKMIIGPQDVPGTRMMWAPHDVAGVLDRWGRHLDLDRITVVVLDERDHGLIPRTFEAMLDLPDRILEPPAERSNVSLSFTEAEAVRQLNVMAWDACWTPEQYWRIIQTGAVRLLKARAPDDGPRITGLPAWALDAVADRSDAQIEAIRSAGCRVIGEVESLRVRGVVDPVELPDAIDSVPLDLLADVVQGAVEGNQRLHDSARRKKRAQKRAQKRPQQSPGADLSSRELLHLLRRRVTGRLRTGGDS